MDGENDLEAITRLESAARGTFGWQVRLQRRGERFGRFFADRRHGGVEESLAAARGWRDALVQRLDEVAAARVCARSPRNSSGVVGVSRVVVSGRAGVEYFFWQATWCPAPGERRSVRFSIRRHGEDGAYRLALEARGGAIGDL